MQSGTAGKDAGGAASGGSNGGGCWKVEKSIAVGSDLDHANASLGDPMYGTHVFTPRLAARRAEFGAAVSIVGRRWPAAPIGVRTDP